MSDRKERVQRELQSRRAVYDKKVKEQKLAEKMAHKMRQRKVPFVKSISQEAVALQNLSEQCLNHKENFLKRDVVQRNLDKLNEMLDVHDKFEEERESRRKEGVTEEVMEKIKKQFEGNYGNFEQTATS